MLKRQRVVGLAPVEQVVHQRWRGRNGGAAHPVNSSALGSFCAVVRSAELRIFCIHPVERVRFLLVVCHVLNLGGQRKANLLMMIRQIKRDYCHAYADDNTAATDREAEQNRRPSQNAEQARAAKRLGLPRLRPQQLRPLVHWHYEHRITTAVQSAIIMLRQSSL